MKFTKILKSLGLKPDAGTGIGREVILYRDLSDGQETHPIPVLSVNPTDEPPQDFKYITRCCNGSNVKNQSSVHELSSCKCAGTCLSECACQTNVGQTKSVYRAGGRLSDSLDLKYPPIIYECNPACECRYDQCENRVIQKTLAGQLASYPVQLYKTQKCGWGIRSVDHIPKGAFLCEYAGELITSEESSSREDDMYFFNLSSDYSAGYMCDSKKFGNWSRFVNHSCEPNTVALKAFTDSQDPMRPMIVFFAIKDIKPFQDVLIDYGERYWVIKCSRESIYCQCGTRKCRFGKRTIKKTSNKFYAEWNKYQEQTKAEQEAESNPPTAEVATDGEVENDEPLPTVVEEPDQETQLISIDDGTPDDAPMDLGSKEEYLTSVPIQDTDVAELKPDQ